MCNKHDFSKAKNNRFAKRLKKQKTVRISVSYNNIKSKKVKQPV